MYRRLAKELEVFLVHPGRPIQGSLENETHHTSQARPIFGFSFEVDSPLGSELIELRIPASLGGLRARAQRIRVRLLLQEFEPLVARKAKYIRIGVFLQTELELW